MRVKKEAEQRLYEKRLKQATMIPRIPGLDPIKNYAVCTFEGEYLTMPDGETTIEYQYDVDTKRLITWDDYVDSQLHTVMKEFKKRNQRRFAIYYKGMKVIIITEQMDYFNTVLENIDELIDTEAVKHKTEVMNRYSVIEMVRGFNRF